ncbi:hypothetical protein [Alkaliphilus transvaalensis]|uniref:hypothetical protein n=1 Tax=Alkaliphilus transvaalensis TaxID=114628 RepID=UPI00047DCD54|nr:hypothetical protein [Alkaliphilus transvaalensis]
MKKFVMMLTMAVVIVGSVGGYVYAQNNGVKNENERAAYGNHCNNNEEMIVIMEEAGFDEMVEGMRTGDYNKMKEIMENLSDEDYNRMIAIMDENGYGNMANMMQSIGREEMLNMHNSMMGRNGIPSMMRSMMGRGRN